MKGLTLMDTSGSSTTNRSARRLRLLACAALALTAGCGTQDADPVAERTQHFYAALGSGDAAAACADLAPQTRKALEQQASKACKDTILDQGLPQSTGPGKVWVYASAAEVSHRGETAFLSRFRTGWLITAVGCKPAVSDQPHDCTLQAG